MDSDEKTSPRQGGVSMKTSVCLLLLIAASVLVTSAADAELEITASHYPIMIALDEILVWTVNIENIGSEDASFDKFKMFFDGPYSFEWNYFHGVELTLTPGSSIYKIMNRHVDPKLPIGIYTVTSVIYLDNVELSRFSFDVCVIAKWPKLFGLFACDGSGSGAGRSSMVTFDTVDNSTWQVDLDSRVQGVGYSRTVDLAVCAGREGLSYVIDPVSGLLLNTVSTTGGSFPGDGVEFTNDGSRVVVHEKDANAAWIFDPSDPPADVDPVVFYDPVMPAIDDLAVTDEMVYMIDYSNDLLWYFDIDDPAATETVEIPGDGSPLKPTSMILDYTDNFLIVLNLGSGASYGSLSFFDISAGYPVSIGWISVNTGNSGSDLNFRGPTDIDLTRTYVNFDGVNISGGDEALAIIGENSGTPGGCAGLFDLNSMLDKDLGTVLVSSFSELLDQGDGMLFLPFPEHLGVEPISDCAISPKGVFMSCSEIGASWADVTTTAEDIEVFDIKVEGDDLYDPDDAYMMVRW